MNATQWAFYTATNLISYHQSLAMSLSVHISVHVISVILSHLITRITSHHIIASVFPSSVVSHVICSVILSHQCHPMKCFFISSQIMSSHLITSRMPAHIKSQPNFISFKKIHFKHFMDSYKDLDHFII